MSDVAGGCGDDDDDGMKIILHAFFLKELGSVLSVQNDCLCSWEKAQNTEKIWRLEAIQSNQGLQQGAHKARHKPTDGGCWF